MVESSSDMSSQRKKHSWLSPIAPPLCSRQLVVTSHLSAPSMPLDAPPSHDWLCRCRRQCAGVVAVNAQASLSSSRLRLSPSLHIVELASSPSLSSRTGSSDRCGECQANTSLELHAFVVTTSYQLSYYTCISLVGNL
jgi:hypothetical protein